MLPATPECYPQTTLFKSFNWSMSYLSYAAADWLPHHQWLQCIDIVTLTLCWNETQLWTLLKDYYCQRSKKGKGSPYSERRVPELIPILGSQPVRDVNHKAGGRLPLLSAKPAVTFSTLKRAATKFAAWWTEARWTVCLRLTRQRRGCDLNPGPSTPESNTITTRLPSHPLSDLHCNIMCANTCERV